MATYRHVTPPSRVGLDDYDTLQCPGGSASSRATTNRSNGWSPATVYTAATTPPRSPRQPGPFTDPAAVGPSLHPHLRPQDLCADPAAAPGHYHTHARTASMPTKPYHVHFGSALPPRDTLQRRSVSPYYDGHAAPPPYEYMSIPVPVYGRPASSGTSSSSNGNTRPAAHSRNLSSSGIDPSMLSRYGYPTYRSHAAGPHGPSALNHLAPVSLSRSNVRAQPVTPRRSASPPLKQSRPIIRLEIPPTENRDHDDYSDSEDDDDEDDEDEGVATSTVLDYLTSPNPSPSLIPRTPDGSKTINTHFWFDIRNLRPWSDFNIRTITGFPDLLKLLRFDIPAELLPSPGKVNLSPDTPAQLAELCANHHAVKVNAALRIAQGERHMAMRTLTSPPGARQQPEFVGNYHSDVEKTIFGDGRGRVVGIVKCHAQWNSGMRAGSPVDKVRYLRHLAHLHRFMREHGSRYGFIITELEVVCVRAGGPPTADNVPLFGYLEVAAPVPVATAAASPPSAGRLAMTADLALWYLHMLAKEQPFPGQFHWRLEVGAPALLTRRRHEPRDEWMPKPNISEKREAKRVRGWVWPEEPLSKRECARSKRIR